MFITHKKLQIQKDTIDQLVFALLCYERTFEQLMGPDRDKVQAGAITAIDFLSEYGLPTSYSGTLHSPENQQSITGLNKRDTYEVQEEHIAVLADELAWYSQAVENMMNNLPVREATHHDASELLEAMGY